MNIEEYKQRKAETEKRIADLIMSEISKFESEAGVEIIDLDVTCNSFELSTMDAKWPKSLHVRKVSLKSNL